MNQMRYKKKRFETESKSPAWVYLYHAFFFEQRMDLGVVTKTWLQHSPIS